jgi:hypothetical protein
MASDQKLLVTFEIQDGTQFRIRSVLTHLHVTEDDATFYYHYLLGFQSYKIRIHSRPVPESFTVSLLGANASEMPQHFPAHDLETDEEGVKRYFVLMERVCEMERMRVEYGIAANPNATKSTSETQTQTPTPSAAPKYKSWVEEVMKTLETTAEANPYSPEDQDQSFAWMITPVLKEVRETRGCRIITDEEIGRKWAPWIGTDVYPDIAINRRFSIVDWKFKHPASEALARQAISWYLEAQMLGAPIHPGISQWILQAEEELVAVLTPFKSVGPLEQFPSATEAPKPKKKDKVHPTTEVLQRLEGEHIVSALTHDSVVTLTADVWERYIRHVFRAFGIGTNIVDSCWGPVQDTIQIWIRGSMGVRTDKPALAPAWQTWWDVLVVPNPTQERFICFLATLDLYDPILSLNLTTSNRYDTASGWIKAYIETEMEVDTNYRVSAASLYNNIRNWCIKYVSIPTVDSAFKPTHIGPVLTTLGYICQRTRSGRMILGLRYKQPVTEEISEEEEKPSVLSYFANQPKPDGLAILAKDEIHLGTL